MNRKMPLRKWFHNFQLSTPTPQTPKAQISKLHLFTISRFLDHVTIVFMLLRTWESIVIEVIINECVVRSKIGYLSNS